MPLVVVLGVGLDSSLLSRGSVDWESAGYIFTQTWSIQGAIDLFRTGDFDLVILGHSLPAESREKLALLIRATGSQIPVVCTTDASGTRNAFADATLASEPNQWLGRIGELLESKTRLHRAQLRSGPGYRLPLRS